MKTLSIKGRLVSLNSVYFLSLIVFFLVAIFSMKRMGNNSSSIYNIRLKGIQNLVEADRDAYQTLDAIHNMFYVDSTNLSDLETYIKDADENIQQVNQRFTLFITDFKESTSEQHSDLEQTYTAGYQQLVGSMNKLIDKFRERDINGARKVFHSEFMPEFQMVRGVLDEFTNISSTDAENEYNSILKAMKTSRQIFIAIFVLLVVVLVVAGYYLVESITVPLNKGVVLAQEIAKGNLMARIDVIRKDEIGALTQALMDMVERLSEIIRNIVNGSENLAKAGNEISGTSQQISQGANQQAASVEELSSTMEEIASNIENNTENAQQTEKISQEANESIKEVGERSSETSNANKEIAQKITIINDIAFQTNILALNAAVEAARAGEHGKGFAVVAAEVRKLAERSKLAADEIVSLAAKSVKYAENAGEVMESTIPKIEKTTKLIQEITAASVEQNNGAGQINSAIQQLTQVSQQNAASSEELATSAEELNSQAEELKDLVEFFKIDNKKSSYSRPRKEPVAPKKTSTPQRPTYSANNKGANISLIDKDRQSDDDFESF